MADYLLGIDNGGSEIKCAVFNTTGSMLSVARKRLPLDQPAPGYTQRDARAVWKANAAAIREAIVESGVLSREIRAVGLTGYGNGMLLVDHSGTPVSPCIVSTDSRAADQCRKFAESGAQRRIFSRTLQTLWAAQPAALIPWFRHNEKETLDRSAKYLGIKDWIRFCLTGTMTTEITEASSTCLFNLKERGFDAEIFRELGIEEYFGLAPACVESTGISGYVTEAAAAETGLCAGIPVSGGYFDIDANALASGILNDSLLCLIAGTWSINQYLSKTANEDYDLNRNTTTLSYLPEHYLIEDSSATSASNFDWFVSHLMGTAGPGHTRNDLYQACDATISAMDPEASDVVFVPYLYDSSAVSGGRGAFFNLNGSHTRDQLLLAVYEGVVFSTAMHVSRLKPQKAFTSARLSGGVAHSPVWSQMMADVLDLPIEIPMGTELAAKGAAMGAGVACGAFIDLAQAVENMYATERIYRPQAERTAIYRKKYETYNKAIEALRVFHR
ncbi:MAG: carbohydrate kinase [Eubacteriales bacterium]|jgi:L-xylulokinase|nr:carbohydrate kinase [Eubacteriales bacterium]MDD3864515.1 carbohydrate kinase [Eubacteriales bacterium]MDD4445300.1 carbohydrate kinase [Eubacteriales bacterium]